MGATIQIGKNNRDALFASRNKRRLNKMAYKNVEKTKIDERPKYLFVYLLLASSLIALVIFEFINGT